MHNSKQYDVIFPINFKCRQTDSTVNQLAHNKTNIAFCQNTTLYDIGILLWLHVSVFH